MLLLVLATGWAQRFHTLPSWIAIANHSPVAGQPTISNLDGYFYLGEARDLLRGQYSETNPLRNAPNGVSRRQPAPMMSRVLAWATRATGAPLSWVGVLAPPILSVLVAIPLFLIGWIVRGPWVGIAAALLGTIAPFYALRTSLGWLDTDSMVVTLTLGITAALMIATQRQGTTRILLLAVSLFLTWLLFEWWDLAPGPVLAFGAFQFVLASALLNGTLKLKLSILATGLAIIVFGIAGIDNAASHAYGFLSQALYVFEQPSTSFWPAIGATVAEQNRPTIESIVRHTTGSPLLLGISILGLVLFVFRAGRNGVLLVAPLGLGLLSIAATRFLIFLGPVLALGTSYTAYLLATQDKGTLKKFRWTGILFFVVSAAAMFLATFNTIVAPIIPPETSRGIAELQETTERDSVIWADWDRGYPIQFWGDRRTVADGTLHQGERTTYLYLPLATDDFLLSSRFMHFFAAHGMMGMRRITELDGDTPGQGYNKLKHWLTVGMGNANTAPLDDAFIFPSRNPPLYLFMDVHTAEAFHLTYMTGQWDPTLSRGNYANSKIFEGVLKEDRRILGSPDVTFDIADGTFEHNTIKYNLKRATLSTSEERTEFSYPHSNGLVLEYREKEQLAIVMPEFVTQTVFFQLFFRNNGGGVFEKVAGDGTRYQLWRVLPPQQPSSTRP